MLRAGKKEGVAKQTKERKERRMAKTVPATMATGTMIMICGPSMNTEPAVRLAGEEQDGDALDYVVHTYYLFV